MSEYVGELAQDVLHGEVAAPAFPVINGFMREPLKVWAMAIVSLWTSRPIDRSLSGNWNGWRDCHIEPDWILIYKVSAEVVTLGRTGAHSGLF